MVEEDVVEPCHTMGEFARKQKIRGLKKFREGIVKQSVHIMCPHDEFNQIRNEANELLDKIDKKLDELEK